MARRGAPSIYELFRKMPANGGGTPSATHNPSIPRSAGSVNSGASLGAGSGQRGQPIVFEVPIVWMVIAIVAVLMMVVVAYNIGLRNAATTGAPNSALQTPAVNPATTTPTTPANTATSPTGAPRSPNVPPLAATDNNGDPRVKGFKYYVLAHPSTERAPAMVEFCRSNGLDAYLVPDDNAMLRKIVVLPGYRDSSEKNSETIRTLEKQIRFVGEKWKNALRGNKDFSDAYPENYR